MDKTSAREPTTAVDDVLRASVQDDVVEGHPLCPGATTAIADGPPRERRIGDDEGRATFCGTVAQVMTGAVGAWLGLTADRVSTFMRQ